MSIYLISESEPILEIDILVKPKSQPRARAQALPNGKAKVFEPTEVKVHKRRIANAIAKAFDSLYGHGDPKRPLETETLEAPWIAEFEFAFQRPLSHYVIKKNSGVDILELSKKAPWFYAQTPDADNLSKSVLDAIVLSGRFGDDSKCVGFSAVKYWIADRLGPADADKPTRSGIVSISIRRPISASWGP